MIGQLPTHITIAGIDYSIRTDFRDILNILCAFNDPDLEENERVYICLFILYEDFEDIPDSNYQEAFEKAIHFIDQGATSNKNKPSPRVVDWEQDESLIFPAINKVAGCETRAVEYIHWWTFIGYYMEISNGVFSHVLELRSKKAKHKKLEKYEQEFWNANKDICVIKPRLSEEEKAERERIEKLLNG